MRQYLKYFYNLYFEYVTSGEFTNTFQIGYFSSLQKAREQIDIYSKKLGFKDYDVSHFHILKLGVRFNEPVNKEDVIFYGLSCEREMDEWDESTFFGLYSTYEEAESKCDEFKRQRKYRTAEFFINKYEPNRNLGWGEGFDKW